MSKRTNIAGASPFEPVIGFSRAVRVGQHVMVSGTGPVGCDDEDVAGQTDQCLTIIAGVLKEAGTSFEHVVRTRIYLTDAADWEAVGRVHGKFFALISRQQRWWWWQGCWTRGGGWRSRRTRLCRMKPLMVDTLA